MKAPLTLFAAIFSCAALYAQPVAGVVTFGFNQAGPVPQYMSVDVLPGNSGTVTAMRWVDFAGANSFHLLLKRDAAGFPVWSRRYDFGANFPNYITTDIHRTRDGGFMESLTGLHSVSPVNNYLALRTDSLGLPVWSKSYEPVLNLDIRNDAQNRETSDHGFVLASDAIDFASQEYFFHLMKIDSSGHVLWSQLFNRTGFKSYHTNLTLCRNDDAVICGWRSNLANISGTCLTRVNANGSLVWSKQYFSGNTINPNDVCETASHDLVTLATETDSLTGYSSVVLIRTDSLGQIRWGKRYQSVQRWIYPDGLIITNDNGIVVYGSSFNATGGTDGFLMKTDSAGQLLWIRRLQSTPLICGQKTANGTLFLGAINNVVQRAFQIRTTSLGQTSCEQGVLPIQTDSLVFQVFPDSAAFALPMNESLFPVSSSPVMIYDTTFCQTPGTIGIAETESNAAAISPNPASDIIRIDFLPAQSQIVIFSGDGKKIVDQQVFDPTISLSVADWPNGIYYVRISSGNNTASQRLSIIHH